MTSMSINLGRSLGKLAMKGNVVDAVTGSSVRDDTKEGKARRKAKSLRNKKAVKSREKATKSTTQAQERKIKSLFFVK